MMIEFVLGSQRLVVTAGITKSEVAGSEVVSMTQGKYVELSVAQRSDVWRAGKPESRRIRLRNTASHNVRGRL
jgi:hypothetical protein